MTPKPLQLRSVAPAYRQIADHMHRLVASGEYSPGTRLPSCQELAATWGSTHNTVHRGLRILIKKGLLRQFPGQGIFVAARSPRLSAIGVYYPAHHLPGSPFQQQVLSGLKRVAQAAGVELLPFPDGRSEEREMKVPWEPLMTAIENGQVQAVIATNANIYGLAWLTKLKLPAALYVSARLPNGVKFDGAAFYRLSLQALRRQGCTTVGLISETDLDRVVLRSEHGKETSYADGFLEACAECGLRTRSQWFRSGARPEDAARCGAVAVRRYGQQRFRQFWKQAERPDGLLIDDDNLAEGSLMAMLEMGVRVPEDLKLVLHQNAHLEYYNPFPVAYIVTDEHVVSQALWRQVQRQFRGEPYELIELQPTLTMPRFSKSALRRPQPTHKELCEVK